MKLLHSPAVRREVNSQPHNKNSSSTANLMNALVSNTNQTLFFEDVPDRGAFRQKPPVPRKTATSLGEALSNLGNDLANTLLFNDLASCANCDCGANYDHELEERDDIGMKKKKEELPEEDIEANDTFTAISDDGSETRTERSTMASCNRTNKISHMYTARYSEPDQERNAFHEMGNIQGNVANQVEQTAKLAGEFIGDMPEFANEVGGMAKKAVVRDAPRAAVKAHDDALDGVNDFLEEIVDEIEDMAKFTAAEVAVAAEEGGVFNAVRYASNVTGLEQHNFNWKNYEMKEERRERARKGFVPKAKVTKNVKGERVPIPYPETHEQKESKVEMECRNRTLSPPALDRQVDDDNKRLKAIKEAAMVKAYEEACYLEQIKIREHYKKQVQKEMNSYEKLVEPARAGKRQNYFSLSR